MILLGATLALPLLMLLACLSSTLRVRMTGWLAIAPIPGLAAALFASDASLDLPPATSTGRKPLTTHGGRLRSRSVWATAMPKRVRVRASLH